MKTDFWTHNVPIVNPETGLPTQDFLRWLTRNKDSIQGASDGLADKADKIIKIYTINGIEGGGDLSADRTFGLTKTGVVPGTYTIANVTVDERGRITFIEDGSLTPPVGPHRYWRVNVTKCTIVGNWIALAELIFRSTAGGADIVPTATAVQYGAAANAFDGNVATTYLSGAAYPGWLSIDCGTAKEVVEVVMKSQTVYMNEHPREFDIQYSDDNATWATAWSVVTALWTNNETRVFTKP